MKPSRFRLWLAVVAGLGLAFAAIAFIPVNAGVTHVRTEIDIARLPHDVYAYVSTPANWPRWHPSSIAVRGDAAHSLMLGEAVDEEFSVAGRRGVAHWRVVARQPDSLWSIEGQIDGRVAGVITYTLSQNAGGTHFVRTFDYPSRTVLFAILNAFVLKARIVEESEKALANLRNLLESKT